MIKKIIAWTIISPIILAALYVCVTCWKAFLFVMMLMVGVALLAWAFKEIFS